LSEVTALDRERFFNSALMKFIPIQSLTDGAYIVHGLLACWSPSHFAKSHAILDEVAAGLFKVSRRNQTAASMDWNFQHA
jgi:hypothetical protein